MHINNVAVSANLDFGQITEPAKQRIKERSGKHISGSTRQLSKILDDSQDFLLHFDYTNESFEIYSKKRQAFLSRRDFNKNENISVVLKDICNMIKRLSLNIHHYAPRYKKLSLKKFNMV